MSSFVYGRYTGTEERAAARGGTPAVVVEENDGRIATDSNNKPTQTLNFAGLVGDKVLALFPAEALALYTMVSDSSENTGEVINLSLGEWFWVVLAAAPIAYLAGRLTAGKYLYLTRVIRNDNYSGRTKFRYTLGEVLRFIVPAVAIASWLLGGGTEMAKAASLPNWDVLNWTETNRIGIQGWGIFLFAVASALAWAADRIGFK